MKKKIVSLFAVLALCLALAVPAFAAGNDYRVGQYVTFSGRTDFDYYYTYTSGDVPYKCFSVVSADGQRYYASVKESLYEYYRSAFANQDVSLRGAVQSITGDGAPVILATWSVKNDGGNESLTETSEFVAPLFYKKGTAPNFKLFADLYDDLTVSASNDGSYMTIDTNPLNLKNGSIIFNEVGTNHVKLTNKVLDLPEWLYEEMANTRALDGRQKEVFSDVTVTWSYHPSQGLEVIYRTNS